jgi:hypothetical protein
MAIAINICSINLFKYGWIHLHTAIVKEDSVSHKSSIYLFRYGWIHLLPARVKADSASHQFSMDIFRYGCIHLLPTIVKEDSSVSCRLMQISRIYLQVYIDSLLLLLEQVEALQLLHFLPLQLVTMVCICSDLQSLVEPHF